MYFSAITLFSLAALTTANPLQIQVEIPKPDGVSKAGVLGDLVTPFSSARLKDDDDKLDIQFGQCYRIKDSNGEKLGLYGVYYQFGGQDSHRSFRVCREAGGSCKHEGRNDQTVRRHEHFYLKDLLGSSISGGATWVASAGTLLYPLPNGHPNLYISKLWGYRECLDPDQRVSGDGKGDPECETCINQKNAWNNWNGLSTQPNTKYVITSPNPDQCIFFTFTKVRCPTHSLAEDEEKDKALPEM